MKLTEHEFYIEFANTIFESKKNNANLLVLSVPGISVSYFINKFIENNTNKGFVYINQKGMALGEYNFLDLDFNQNKNSLKLAIEYFKKAKLNQKFAVVINTPELLNGDTYKSSFLASHLYKTFVFKVLDLKLIEIFATELNVKLDQNQLQKILDLSGGLSRIAKYLLINSDLLQKSLSEILFQADFNTAIFPTATTVAATSEEILKKIGVINNDEIVSLLLREYLASGNIYRKPEIDITSDLQLLENGQKFGKKLLKTEKELLLSAINNRGIIFKETIADIKWGKGSYDDYSDQAIGKTMQRLNKKLKLYTFSVIPKIGYKIEKKNG